MNTIQNSTFVNNETPAMPRRNKKRFVNNKPLSSDPATFSDKSSTTPLAILFDTLYDTPPTTLSTTPPTTLSTTPPMMNTTMNTTPPTTMNMTPPMMNTTMNTTPPTTPPKRFVKRFVKKSANNFQNNSQNNFQNSSERNSRDKSVNNSGHNSRFKSANNSVRNPVNNSQNNSQNNSGRNFRNKSASDPVRNSMNNSANGYPYNLIPDFTNLSIEQFRKKKELEFRQQQKFLFEKQQQEFTIQLNQLYGQQAQCYPSQYYPPQQAQCYPPQQAQYNLPQQAQCYPPINKIFINQRSVDKPANKEISREAAERLNKGYLFKKNVQIENYPKFLDDQQKLTSLYQIVNLFPGNITVAVLAFTYVFGIKPILYYGKHKYFKLKHGIYSNNTYKEKCPLADSDEDMVLCFKSCNLKTQQIVCFCTQANYIPKNGYIPKEKCAGCGKSCPSLCELCKGMGEFFALIKSWMKDVTIVDPNNGPYIPNDLTLAIEAHVIMDINENERSVVNLLGLSLYPLGDILRKTFPN